MACRIFSSCLLGHLLLEASLLGAQTSRGAKDSAGEWHDGGVCAAALEVVVGDRRVPVAPTQRLVLGRGTDADLVLNHPRVSRRHLVLEHGPHGWTATDHSRNGTFNGGERITTVTLTASTTLSSVESATVSGSSCTYEVLTGTSTIRRQPCPADQCAAERGVGPGVVTG